MKKVVITRSPETPELYPSHLEELKFGGWVEGDGAGGGCKIRQRKRKEMRDVKHYQNIEN